MKSFLHFTEEVNLASGLSIVGNIDVYGMKHKLYISKHATEVRDRNQSKRTMVNNSRLRDITERGLTKFIESMGEEFIRKYDEFHGNINIKEEKINPYIRPIRIYYPIKSLDEMYDSEKLFEYKSKKREESFEEFEKNMKIDNRYNYLVVSMGKTEEIVKGHEKGRSKKENKTFEFNKKKVYLFDEVTIVSAICDGKQISTNKNLKMEKNTYSDKKELLKNKEIMDLVRNAYNSDSRNQKKLKADGYEILI